MTSIDLSGIHFRAYENGDIPANSVGPKRPGSFSIGLNEIHFRRHSEFNLHGPPTPPPPGSAQITFDGTDNWSSYLVGSTSIVSDPDNPSNNVLSCSGSTISGIIYPAFDEVYDKTYFVKARVRFTTAPGFPDILLVGGNTWTATTIDFSNVVDGVFPQGTDTTVWSWWDTGGPYTSPAWLNNWRTVELQVKLSASMNLDTSYYIDNVLISSYSLNLGTTWGVSATAPKYFFVGTDSTGDVLIDDIDWGP